MINNLKRAVHELVSIKIRIKELVPEPCEYCGDQKTDAHHDDYSEPLKIRWLCRKHHIRVHKNLKLDNIPSTIPTRHRTLFFFCYNNDHANERVFSNFKAGCLALGLPYHTLKQINVWPKIYGEWTIYKKEVEKTAKP